MPSNFDLKFNECSRKYSLIEMRDITGIQGEICSRLKSVIKDRCGDTNNPVFFLYVDARRSPNAQRR